MITNVLTNYIQKSYSLDSMSLQLISSFSIKILNYCADIFNQIDNDDVINTFNKYYNTLFYCGIILIIVYILRYAKKNKLFIKPIRNKIVSRVPQEQLNLVNSSDSVKQVEYRKITIDNVFSVIDSFHKYMKLHPDFFYTGSTDKIILDENGKNLDIYSGKVFFKDILHNISGYFITTYTVESTEKGNIINHKIDLYCEITDNLSRQCYISQVVNYVKHQFSHGDYINLNYFKILANNVIEYAFYENNIDKWKDDVKTLRKEFFSHHKDYLFKIMDNKHSDSSLFDSSWNNLILHGPPGTGKSSFVNRIAITLKMDIISVDLSLYMDKKKELFAMFHRQQFTLPNNNNPVNINNKYIIILDEFDTCLNKLMDLEKIYEYRKVITDNHFNIKNDFIDNKVKNITQVKKMRGGNINRMDGENENDNDAMVNMYGDMLGGGVDMKSVAMAEMNDTQLPYEYGGSGIDQTDDEKLDADNRKNNRKFNEAIANVSNEIGFVIKTLNDENKSDILRLHDLLELFQGPVTVRDRMIVATTNHYDKIKNILPALFRSGRLTPLKFDYLDWESFCELCEYYYGVIPDKKFDITIPTSQIIEMTQKHKDNYEGFIADIY